MSVIQTLFIPLSLLIGGGLGLLVGPRSRVAGLLPAAGAALGLVFLFLARGVEPVTMQLGGWHFAVSETAWRLSLPVLLLTLAAALPLGVALVRSATESDESVRSAAAAALLAAAALPMLWAADLFTQTAAYMLFVVVWGVVLYRFSALDRRAAWLLGPIFVLFFAAAPAFAGQSRLMLPSLLLAAWLAAGAWPFVGWREATDSLPPALRMMAIGLPVVAAAAFVAPYAASSSAPGLLIVVTVAALVGFALGLRAAWAAPMTVNGLVTGLAPSLAGLFLLAAVWLDAAALFAAIHLALFVPAVLLLVAETGAAPADALPLPDADAPLPRRHPVRLVAIALGYLALAGMPLTVGFAVLAPLYAAWGSGFAVALVVALGLLVMLWLAAAGWLALRARSTRAPFTAAVPAAFGLIVAAVGLLRVDLDAVRGLPWPVWVALLVPAVAGLLLPRLLAGHDEWRALLREALTIRVPEVGRPSLRRAAATAVGAVTEAAAILEGNGGLLWLLGFLTLFFLLA